MKKPVAESLRRIRPDGALTVGTLVEELQRRFTPDTVICFGSSDLTLYRLKSRGEKLVQFEFNELYDIQSLDASEIPPKL